MVCLALGLVLIAACSPDYNWRELPVADGAARAAFPARPATETRDIALHGVTLPFSLTSARVGDAVFAVGHARLPPALRDDRAARRALAEELLRGLYDNLRAPAPAQYPPYGGEVEVHGRAGGHPVWALARVWVRGDMLFEAVATGSEKGLPRQVARDFVKSIQFPGEVPEAKPAQ